jgi:peptidoglycan-associated lipoprotein
MSRSRSVVLPILTLAAVLAVTGCARKKVNPEIRLSDTNPMTDPMAELASADGSMGGSSFGPGGAWAPGGAPDGLAGGSGVDSSFAPVGEGAGSGFDASTIPYDSTGSMQQNANLAGVDSATQIADLEMIHFNYDQAEIDPDWVPVLERHAEWLRTNSNVFVQVEGHCDERGTEEYNVALGQRRADAVRDFLVQAGVEPHRVSTLSYGKLRPLTFDGTDESHALNRRAMFLVYSPEAAGTQTAGGF